MSRLRKLSLIAMFVASFALCSVDGASAHETRRERANKQAVLDFYAALNGAVATNSLKQQARAIAETYLSPDYYQHSEQYRNLPGSGSDRDKFIASSESVPDRPAGAPQIPAPRTEAIMARGNLVMLLTSRETRDPATGAVRKAYIFNMFSVKGGKLVDHWDVMPGSSPGPATGATAAK